MVLRQYWNSQNQATSQWSFGLNTGPITHIHIRHMHNKPQAVINPSSSTSPGTTTSPWPQMASYQYSKLADATTNIRILTLHPGVFEDDLRASVSHVSLLEMEPPKQRMSLEELRSTLPPKWRVYETVDTRYIFEHPESETTTWAHPDGSVSAATYELRAPSENPYGLSPPSY